MTRSPSDGSPAAPTSSAAPQRHNDLGLVAPDDDDDDDRLRMPQVRIAGFKLSSIVLLVMFIAGAFFGLRWFIHYSTDEVTRAKTEVHEAFAP